METNELIETIGYTAAGNRIGILKTPCYPAMYYGGFVVQMYHGEFWGTDNATCNYHRTVEAAREWAKRMLD